MSQGVSPLLQPESRLHLVGPPRRGEAPDERPLVEALVRGDRAAAVVAYQRFEPLARRLLRRVVGPTCDADDLVQEVFLRLFQHIDTLANPQALTAFVITTTTRVAQSELRRRFVRRLMRPLADEELPELAGAEPDLATREAVARFYRVLDKLSAADRTAFVLRFMEDLELGEVAAVLGVSLATVKRRIERVWTRVERLVAQDAGLQEYLAGLRGGAR
jgi:RNA polymerase sigma-70 factor, ECF subfamily